MTAKTRVERLERRAAPTSGTCTCDGNLRVVYENDTFPELHGPPGPEVCPKCGRPRLTFRVCYVEGWRPREEEV